MANFGRKLEEATKEDLYFDVNNLNPTYGSLASDELTRRDLRELKESLDKFSSSSDKYSKELVFLTYVLVFLTIILSIPLLIELIKWLNTLPRI
jgi:hypothetical protein